MLHEHFLNAMSGLAIARTELDHYALLARYQNEVNGLLPTRLGDRWVYLPNATVMVEATWRLMKYVQHGGSSSLTDAHKLWAKASATQVPEIEGSER